MFLDCPALILTGLQGGLSAEDEPRPRLKESVSGVLWKSCVTLCVFMLCFNIREFLEHTIPRTVNEMRFAG
eukprot:scaffold23862_cov98-Cylindrotheca_fusiformis.AAC.1